MPTPNKVDSHYRPVERKERHFNPLGIPRKLQAELPFKSKPKVRYGGGGVLKMCNCLFCLNQ